MNPTDAGTERYRPEISNEKTPPTSANGRLHITRKASFTELKSYKQQQKYQSDDQRGNNHQAFRCLLLIFKLPSPFDDNTRWEA